MRAFALPILFFAGILFDWWWGHYLGFWGLAPSWLFVLTIALAAAEGPLAAQVLGFGWGLYLDVMAVHFFGANALGLSLFAWGVGRARKHIDLSSAGAQAVLVGAASALYFPFYWALSWLASGSAMGSGPLALFGLPLANAAAAPVVFYFLLPRRRYG